MYLKRNKRNNPKMIPLNGLKQNQLTFLVFINVIMAGLNVSQPITKENCSNNGEKNPKTLYTRSFNVQFVSMRSHDRRQLGGWSRPYKILPKESHSMAMQIQKFYSSFVAKQNKMYSGFPGCA
jgi:hypothetical protein